MTVSLPKGHNWLMIKSDRTIQQWECQHCKARLTHFLDLDVIKFTEGEKERHATT